MPLLTPDSDPASPPTAGRAMAVARAAVQELAQHLTTVPGGQGTTPPALDARAQRAVRAAGDRLHTLALDERGLPQDVLDVLEQLYGQGRLETGNARTALFRTPTLAPERIRRLWTSAPDGWHDREVRALLASHTATPGDVLQLLRDSDPSGEDNVAPALALRPDVGPETTPELWDALRMEGNAVVLQTLLSRSDGDHWSAVFDQLVQVAPHAAIMVVGRNDGPGGEPLDGVRRRQLLGQLLGSTSRTVRKQALRLLGLEYGAALAAGTARPSAVRGPDRSRSGSDEGVPGLPPGPPAEPRHETARADDPTLAYRVYHVDLPSGRQSRTRDRDTAGVLPE